MLRCISTERTPLIWSYMCSWRSGVFGQHRKQQRRTHYNVRGFAYFLLEFGPVICAMLNGVVSPATSGRMHETINHELSDTFSLMTSDALTRAAVLPHSLTQEELAVEVRELLRAIVNLLADSQATKVCSILCALISMNAFVPQRTHDMHHDRLPWRTPTSHAFLFVCCLGSSACSPAQVVVQF